MSDSFRIGVREFQSRLMVGTGKYANDQLAIDSIRESGADIVTMAIRRVRLLKVVGPAWNDGVHLCDPAAKEGRAA
jgi:thiazole synthase